MTEVHFYTGLPDKVQYACTLVSKVVRRGKRVVVFSGDVQQMARFDQMLWSEPPLSFVPHVMSEDPLAAQTQVVMITKTPDDDEPLPHHDVLVNLDANLPKFFSRFAYLMELVNQNDADSEAARERWKFYKQRGYTIEHHPKTTR